MPRRQLHEFSTTGMDTDFLFFFLSLSPARVFTLPRTDLSRVAYMRRLRGSRLCLSDFGEFHWEARLSVSRFEEKLHI